MVKIPSSVHEGTATAVKYESYLSQYYEQNDYDQKPTNTTYQNCKQHVMCLNSTWLNKGNSVLAHTRYPMASIMIFGIVSILMIVMLYYAQKLYLNITQNIDKNKEFIMKYQMTCFFHCSLYPISYAHIIKIYKIYQICVFTLFNISYLKLSVYLTCCICFAICYNVLEAPYVAKIMLGKWIFYALGLVYPQTDKTMISGNWVWEFNLAKLSRIIGHGIRTSPPAPPSAHDRLFSLMINYWASHFW